MMNLFANGGRYVEPVFVEGIVDEYTQSVTESLYRPVQRQVMDKDVAEVIRQMLVGVVEEGLGRKAAPRAGGAGGKTGTAQTGRYQEDGEEIMDAWFVGFYPAEEPRYTIAAGQRHTRQRRRCAGVRQSNGCPELFSCAGVSRPGLDIARI